jgi:hypothetical protein
MLNELLSSDPTLIKESSIDLSFPIIDSEPPTREIGTDPMEPIPSTLPLIIKTTNGNPLTTKPIFLIQTMNKSTVDNSLSSATTTMPTEYYNFQIETSTNDYPMEDNLPLTPSSSSESPDEQCSNSPDNTQSSMLTNFDVNQYLI